MLVKLLVPRSGAGGALGIGDEVEVSAAEAERMEAKGQCLILGETEEEQPPVEPTEAKEAAKAKKETATKKTKPETAAK